MPPSLSVGLCLDYLVIYSVLCFVALDLCLYQGVARPGTALTALHLPTFLMSQKSVIHRLCPSIMSKQITAEQKVKYLHAALAASPA